MCVGGSGGGGEMDAGEGGRQGILNKAPKDLVSQLWVSQSF